MRTVLNIFCELLNIYNITIIIVRSNTIRYKIEKCPLRVAGGSVHSKRWIYYYFGKLPQSVPFWVSSEVETDRRTTYSEWNEAGLRRSIETQYTYKNYSTMGIMMIEEILVSLLRYDFKREIKQKCSEIAV